MKLVICDVDGTLAKDDKSIPSAFFTLAKKLKEKGVRLGIASGRQYAKLKSIFQSLGDDTFYIAENGALIYEGDKLLKTAPLSEALTLKTCLRAYSYDDLKCYIAGINSSYVISEDPLILNEIRIYCEHFKTLAHFEELRRKDEYLKVAILDLSHKASKHYHLFEDLNEEAIVTVSGDRWIDVNAKEATKGQALSFIKQRLALSAKDVVAFGDYGNDVSLLKEAYYSFAMANATEEVKEVANFSCPSNNDEGVIKALGNLYHL